ncbi:PIN domain-containing protein [Tsukamurella sputi]|uniref:PIN domain-containing protein n=1 Tax=Tsukamurella sputi TaxID=2591848 RepID=UPI0013155180|nr:PIN domain-containing protein [Tsukamurella sputi]
MTPSPVERPVPHIVDNSVWSRIQTGEITITALESFTTGGNLLATCTPQLLEALCSTRSPSEWDSEYALNWEFLDVLHPGIETHAVSVELQRRLWHAGKVRAAGPVDTMIAAIALRHGAIVVHHDGDYEQIAEVAPEFQQVRV